MSSIKTATGRTNASGDSLIPVAGNGLLHRRAFLRGSGALAAAFTGYTLSETASAQTVTDAPWSKTRLYP